jgi:hypothetical protein
MKTHHSDPDVAKWKLADEMDIARVKQKEKEDAQHPVYRSPCYLCCARCRHKAYESQIVLHLKNESVFLRSQMISSTDK